MGSTLHCLCTLSAGQHVFTVYWGFFFVCLFVCFTVIFVFVFVFVLFFGGFFFVFFLVLFCFVLFCLFVFRFFFFWGGGFKTIFTITGDQVTWILSIRAEDILSPDCRRKKRAYHINKKYIAMTDCLFILYPAWSLSVIAIAFFPCLWCVRFFPPAVRA